MRRPRPWSAAEFAGLLELPGAFLVAEGAGFALGRVVLDEAELLTLAVAPEAQRRGLGARCLAGYEAEAAARGAALSHLEVAADNAAALALYRRAGYGESGRRRGYYAEPPAPPADALLMSKALGPT